MDMLKPALCETGSGMKSEAVVFLSHLNSKIIPLRKEYNPTLKELKRVLGVDDGPFNRDVDRETSLVGVMTRFDGYVEGVVTRMVEIDGTNSTDRILSMFDSHFASQIDYIMLNGVTFAGFNICDICSLNEKTGRPVVSITRRLPDINEMESALKKHFADHTERIRILKKTETREIRLKSGNYVYANVVGISVEDAALLIDKTIIRGNIPEPVRLAHMIAGAIKTGENKGRS